MSEQYGAPGNAQTNPLSIDEGDLILVEMYERETWAKVLWTDGTLYDAEIVSGPYEGSGLSGWCNEDVMLDVASGDGILTRNEAMMKEND
jgi:hypothetical protein